MHYPIFSAPHKAIRFALGKLVHLAGTIDVNEKKQVQQLANLFDDVYSMVYTHSHHEDDILFAALDAITQGKTTHDRLEHIRLHDQLEKTKQAVEAFAINAISGHITTTDADRLYDTLCAMQSDMLIHMIEEETITQPVFWQYMTNEQLEAFRLRIMATMTATESNLWLKYIFASHSFTYVAALLSTMKQYAPEEIYARTIQLAEEILPKSFLKKIAA